jgi:hypothetical protein
VLVAAIGDELAAAGLVALPAEGVLDAVVGLERGPVGERGRQLVGPVAVALGVLSDRQLQQQRLLPARQQPPEVVVVGDQRGGARLAHGQPAPLPSSSAPAGGSSQSGCPPAVGM